ncbi:ribonuclease H-like domain-containing protein [Tanacetum coccineum]
MNNVLGGVTVGYGVLITTILEAAKFSSIAHSMDTLHLEIGVEMSKHLSIVTTSRYVVPTGRVKVLAGRYVVPTGKDKFIVSAGRTKVILAGGTILVLVVLCLLSGIDRNLFPPEDQMADFHSKAAASRMSQGIFGCLSQPDWSTTSKSVISDQSHSTLLLLLRTSPAASSNVIEMISIPLLLKINKFAKEKSRGESEVNNKGCPQGFLTRRRFKCYKCSELGHLLGKCTGNSRISKARFISFNLRSWIDRSNQSLGMIDGAREDATGIATGDSTRAVLIDVSNAAAEFCP